MKSNAEAKHQNAICKIIWSKLKYNNKINNNAKKGKLTYNNKNYLTYRIMWAMRVFLDESVILCEFIIIALAKVMLPRLLLLLLCSEIWYTQILLMISFNTSSILFSISIMVRIVNFLSNSILINDKFLRICITALHCALFYSIFHCSKILKPFEDLFFHRLINFYTRFCTILHKQTNFVIVMTFVLNFKLWEVIFNCDGVMVIELWIQRCKLLCFYICSRKFRFPNELLFIQHLNKYLNSFKYWYNLENVPFCNFSHVDRKHVQLFFEIQMWIPF